MLYYIYENEEYKLVHVAQAENVKERIEILRAASDQPDGTIQIAACYLPRYGLRERRAIVDEIQGEFDKQENQECDNHQLAMIAS